MDPIRIDRTAVAILMPGYPDAVGGVADQTVRLVRSWSANNCLVAVKGDISVDPTTLALELSTAGVRSVLIQYVPFLYARKGLSRFPRKFAIAARERGIRTTVFVHEPWVPATRIPWWILSPLQKRQLRQLVGIVDTVVTPVPAWGRELGTNATIIYSGTNLGTPTEEMLRQPAGNSPTVFSPFAAGLNWEWIAAAVERVDSSPPPSPLTIIGASAEQFRRHPVTGRWFRKEWDYKGRLEADDTLSLIAKAPLILAPFIDGVTGRRTSISAALSTGVRIVSSDGHLYDDAFDDSPIHVARSQEEFSATTRELLRAPDTGAARAERLAWYVENVDYHLLDSHLLSLVTGQKRQSVYE